MKMKKEKEMTKLLERRLRTGKLLELGINDGWLEAYVDGQRVARDTSIGVAPKHDFSSEFTRILGLVLLTEAEAEKMLAARQPQPQASNVISHKKLSREYEEACYRVRKSFESENTCAQGPAFAKRESARKALEAWNAVHPEYLTYLKRKMAEADARHGQSFLARGLD